MGDVAGVDHERGFYRQRLDSVDGFFVGAGRIGIGWLVEANMAVADLQECQASRALCHRFVDDAERARHTARYGPQHSGSSPGHAFKDLATADAAASLLIVVTHGSLLGCQLRPPEPRSREALVYSRNRQSSAATLNLAQWARASCKRPARRPAAWQSSWIRFSHSGVGRARVANG